MRAARAGVGVRGSRSVEIGKRGGGQPYWCAVARGQFGRTGDVVAVSVRRHHGAQGSAEPIQDRCQIACHPGQPGVDDHRAVAARAGRNS